ncbi:MAG TPA: hypothetical protein VFD36_29595 [Kofleriaceae bacterium]|nr:hypothetical protein [Kofleriaceae bacterium]
MTPPKILPITWTCLVCRCDQTSGRQCRVLVRGENQLALAHLTDPRMQQIIALAGSWKPSAMSPEANEDYADRLAYSVYDHFTTKLDDVICADCDVLALAKQVEHRVNELCLWADMRHRVEVKSRPRDLIRPALDAAWGQVQQKLLDLSNWALKAIAERRRA